MDYCLNSRKDVCNKRVRFSRWPKQMESSEDIPSFPLGRAQEELDHICEDCPHAIFLIEDRCPVCMTEIIRVKEPTKTIFYGKLGPIRAYHCECPGCGRKLYYRIASPC